MKQVLTANEIRYRELFPELTERNFNPMNDVLFKFIFGRPERKALSWFVWRSSFVENSHKYKKNDVSRTANYKNF